jgi:hypothetical protein
MHSSNQSKSNDPNNIAQYEFANHTAGLISGIVSTMIGFPLDAGTYNANTKRFLYETILNKFDMRLAI